MLLPTDLTIPAPDSTTARRVVGADLKRTLTELLRFPSTRFSAPVADDFAQLRPLLAQMLRDERAGAVYSVIRRPNVSTLIRCLNGELWGAGDVAKLDRWLVELNALLAFELASSGQLPNDGLRLRQHPETMLSISRRVRVRLPADCNVGFLPGQLVLGCSQQRFALGLDRLLERPAPDGCTIDSPYAEIAGDLLLALADNNPLSDLEAHPDKSGNAIDLGGRPMGEWCAALGAALDLVQRYLPELGRELPTVLQVIIPVGYSAERHMSASYGESIGVAYLSLHPDLMTMAEALVHEFSHNKINALWHLDPVLENAFSPLFASPVRPDPRPLHGVMLAVHAFTPVAMLYERMMEAGDPRSEAESFRARFTSIVRGNHDAVNTLRSNARPTAVGQAVLDELTRWDTHFSRVAAL